MLGLQEKVDGELVKDLGLMPCLGQRTKSRELGEHATPSFVSLVSPSPRREACSEP